MTLPLALPGGLLFRPATPVQRGALRPWLHASHASAQNSSSNCGGLVGEVITYHVTGNSATRLREKTSTGEPPRRASLTDAPRASILFLKPFLPFPDQTACRHILQNQILHHHRTVGLHDNNVVEQDSTTALHKVTFHGTQLCSVTLASLLLL